MRGRRPETSGVTNGRCRSRMASIRSETGRGASTGAAFTVAAGCAGASGRGRIDSSMRRTRCSFAITARLGGPSPIRLATDRAGAVPASPHRFSESNALRTGGCAAVKWRSTQVTYAPMKNAPGSVKPDFCEAVS